MIRVLHVLSSLDGGGVESLLYSYYKNMDRNKFRFDFAILDTKIGKMENLFVQLGTTIYRLPPKRNGLLKSIDALDQILKNNNYDIVHSHQNMNAIFAMYVAKKNQIKVRIAHSHYGNIPHAQLLEKQSVRFFLRPILKYLSTEWFACSNSAAVSLWGKKGSKSATILYNAIDLEAFAPDNKKSEEIRKILGLNGKKISGCVARLNAQKNLIFLLKIFKDVIVNNNDARLVIVGDGDQRLEIEKYISDNNLANYVILLGNRNDVAEIIKCFDIFVLPSAFEGLGIVYIESQASGIPTFASNKVPIDTKITNLIKYLPIDNTDVWVENINNELNKIREGLIDCKEKYVEEVRIAHYDIVCESKRLEQLYTQYVEGESLCQ